MKAANYPVLRPIADTGVLVEFGDSINDDTHQKVLDFDVAITAASLAGFIQSTPSFTAVLVSYDPLKTDYELVCEHIEKHLSSENHERSKTTHWQIPVCYAEPLAPDLLELADKLSLSTDEVIEQHSRGRYKIYMFGFAPGYAYMGGVPDAIQIPRKQAPVMNVPQKTVMIAGPQCLITTLPMPTGWWRIGMTTQNPLQLSKEQPFQFGVGDTIEFLPMSEREYRAHNSENT